MKTRYDVLIDLVQERKPRTILEVGTWSGQNALRMIRAAAFYWGIDKITYYGFDLFEENATTEELNVKAPAYLNNVRNLLTVGKVSIRLTKGNTKETLKQFVPQKGHIPLDFVFIDGGHSLETIASDWMCLKDYVDHTTYILFDDYYPENDKYGAKQTVEQIKAKEIIYYDCNEVTCFGDKNVLVRVQL